MTLALAGAAAIAAVVPEAGRGFEYDRSLALATEPWRTLTSQLVHWTPRMALLDLAVLLGVAAWLERRSRGTVAAALVAGALAVAVVLVADTDLMRYRGSSGLASAVVAAAAVHLAFRRDGWPRWAAVVTLVAFAGKIAAELWTGDALAAGALPDGVAVLPAVHGAAALAGLAATLLLLSRPSIAPGQKARAAGSGRATLGPPETRR